MSLFMLYHYSNAFILHFPHDFYQVPWQKQPQEGRVCFRSQVMVHRLEECGGSGVRLPCIHSEKKQEVLNAEAQLASSFYAVLNLRLWNDGSSTQRGGAFLYQAI